jgi:hypothetical protein
MEKQMPVENQQAFSCKASLRTHNSNIAANQKTNFFAYLCALLR